MPSAATENMIAATRSLIARKGWLRTTMLDIAREADLGLIAGVQAMPTKLAVIDPIFNDLETAMLEKLDAELDDEELRERLFEVIMAWFDAMQTNRAEMEPLMKALPLDPLLSAAVARRFETTLDVMLEAANLKTTPLETLPRRRALGLLMADLTRVWIGDNSEDMAKTMAALDKRMGQVEDAVTQLLTVAMDLANRLPIKPGFLG